jgi:hypothetical protein
VLATEQSQQLILLARNFPAEAAQVAMIAPQNYTCVMQVRPCLLAAERFLVSISVQSVSYALCEMRSLLFGLNF